MITNEVDWSKYLCGISITAMSMISNEICWWGISVEQVIPVIKVIEVIQVIQVIKIIQLIQVMLVRLAHLWPDIRVTLVSINIYKSEYQLRTHLKGQECKNWMLQNVNWIHSAQVFQEECILQVKSLDSEFGK